MSARPYRRSAFARRSQTPAGNIVPSGTRVACLHASAQQPAAPLLFSLYLYGSGIRPASQANCLFCVSRRHLPQKMESTTTVQNRTAEFMACDAFFSLLRYKRKLGSDHIATKMGVGWHIACRCEYRSSAWNGELTSVACPWTVPMGLCQDFGHK